MQTIKDSVWVGWLVSDVCEEIVLFQRVGGRLPSPPSTCYTIFVRTEHICKSPSS